MTPVGPDIGEAKAIPPILTAVYSLSMGRVRPYVGAGLAVMFVTDAHVTNPVLTAVAEPEMSLSPAPGLVLQTGIDARLWKGLFARVDIKYIAFMLASAEIRHIQVQTPLLPLFQTVEVGTARMSVWVNPLIIQAALGLDF
jgi:outer membrane protein W